MDARQIVPTTVILQSQQAKKAGASRIFAIDINESKFELAKKWGATDCLNPKKFDKPIQQVLRLQPSCVCRLKFSMQCCQAHSPAGGAGRFGPWRLTNRASIFSSLQMVHSGSLTWQCSQLSLCVTGVG